MAAVLHINKSNATGNSKRLYTPKLAKLHSRGSFAIVSCYTAVGKNSCFFLAVSFRRVWFQPSVSGTGCDAWTCSTRSRPPLLRRSYSSPLWSESTGSIIITIAMLRGQQSTHFQLVWLNTPIHDIHASWISVAGGADVTLMQRKRSCVKDNEICIRTFAWSGKKPCVARKASRFWSYYQGFFLRKMLGTRYEPVGTRSWFSLTLGTRFSVLGTRIGSLKHLKKLAIIKRF